MYPYMNKETLGNRLVMKYIQDYQGRMLDNHNGRFNTIIVSPGAKEILTMRIDPERLEKFRDLVSTLQDRRLSHTPENFFLRSPKIMDIPYYETLREREVFSDSSFKVTDLALFAQLNQSMENYDDTRKFGFISDNLPSNYMRFEYFLHHSYHFMSDYAHYFFRSFPDVRLIPMSNPSFFDKNYGLSTGLLLAPGDLGKLHHDAWDVRERHRFNKRIPLHEQRINLNYPSYLNNLSRAHPFNFDSDHLSYFFKNRLFTYPFVALLDSTPRLEHTIHPYGDAADNFDVSTTQYRISCRPTFTTGQSRKKINYYFKDFMLLTPTNKMVATKKAREQYLHFLNKSLPFVFEFTPIEELFPTQLHQIEARLPKANIDFI